MYYTNYFDGINISTLKTSLSNISSKIDSLIDKNNTVSNTASNTTWEADAKNTFTQGFDHNSSILSNIKSQLSSVTNILSMASEIVFEQDYIKNGNLDYSTMQEETVKINSNLEDIKIEISKMNMGSSYLSSAIQGNNSSTFNVNTEKIKNLKDEFSSYSSDVISAYDLFNSLESNLSSDSYLIYIWGLVASNFDDLVKKRDKMYEWITNYVDNLTVIENNLPDTEKGVTITACTTYAKSRTYATEPSFDDYKSSARGEEIKEPVEEDTSYAGSDYSSGGGSYYSPSGGGYSGTNTDNSGSDSSRWSSGDENYRKAIEKKESGYNKYNSYNGTDTSDDYATKYKGQSDYERAKNSLNYYIAGKKYTLNNKSAGTHAEKTTYIGNPTSKNVTYFPNTSNPKLKSRGKTIGNPHK